MKDYNGILVGYNTYRDEEFRDDIFLYLTIHTDPEHPENTHALEMVGGCLAEGFWNSYLEPRIKNYRGRIIAVGSPYEPGDSEELKYVSRSAVNLKKFQKISLLDLPEKEKSLSADYASLEERIRKLEAWTEESKSKG